MSPRDDQDGVTSRLPFFDSTPVWGAEDGAYGQQMGQAMQAHRYVRQHGKEYDQGYRFPPSG